jgi:DGQHR domain-containing protein
MVELGNIEPADNLKSLARRRSRHFNAKTVNISSIEEYEEQGWAIEKRYEHSARMKKEKIGKEALEDRVWTLFYKMEFLYLNGDGRAQLTADVKIPQSQTVAIDVVGIDEEVAVGAWCHPDTRPSLRSILDSCISARQRFVQSVRQQYPLLKKPGEKRQIAMALFVGADMIISEEDEVRAKNGDIVIFRERELQYYEELVSHLGPAARYQLLADLLSEKHIPGLDISVPAIKTKVGDYTFYTFPISPERLLKIAYVAHRSKGAKSDIDAYQRAVQKSRISSIKKYIEEKNIFPTNIVVNFRKKLRFDKFSQDPQQDGGILGMLHIEGEYKSAWIIDGQHRLFAYSGLHFAQTARLSVLAFEELQPDIQAKLFVDINYQQKSVKKSLLHELYGVLHENSDDPEVRTRAIIMQTISLLNDEPASPFYQRILATDDKKTETRCISTNALFNALLRYNFYIQSRKKDAFVYGPFWSDEGSEAMRTRSVYIIHHWFTAIRESAITWWDAGSGDGGGLAMNDSITACFIVLRDVLHHIEEDENIASITMTKENLAKRIQPYACMLGDCLSTFTDEKKMGFRKMYGRDGQTKRAKILEWAMHEKISSFDPPGLQDYIKKEKVQTNVRAKVIIDEIEVILQETIIDELKREYGREESQWWMRGIPQGVRIEAGKKYELAGADRGGGRENYFNFIDYKEIIIKNWDVFGHLFGQGKANAKRETRIAWIQKVNDLRNIVAHSSSGRSVELEQLAELEEYGEWLRKQINNLHTHEEDPEEEAVE